MPITLQTCSLAELTHAFHLAADNLDILRGANLRAMRGYMQQICDEVERRRALVYGTARRPAFDAAYDAMVARLHAV